MSLIQSLQTIHNRGSCCRCCKSAPDNFSKDQRKFRLQPSPSSSPSPTTTPPPPHHGSQLRKSTGTSLSPSLKLMLTPSPCCIVSANNKPQNEASSTRAQCVVP